MSRQEKIKKAITVAVAYYIEQEKAEVLLNKAPKARTSWAQVSRAIQMNARRIIQQRASISSPGGLFSAEESGVMG